MSVSKNPLQSTTGQESQEPIDPYAELDLPENNAQEAPKQVPVTPEAPKPGTEKSIEQELGEIEKEVIQEEEKGRLKARVTQAKPAAAAPDLAVPQKSVVQKEIEDVLEEDLSELYLQLDAEQQRLFKEKGEETAGKIAQLIASAKATARKITSLIIEWLKIIPGVNKFFLEQEAKIKADKILALHKKEENLEE